MSLRRSPSSSASAGCDGWSGVELAAMPEEVFQTFLVLVQRWSLASKWPAVWTHVRQVHLRKTNRVGPVLPKDLRPISVLSIWYRCLISATMRKPETQTWLQNVAPPACHGGIKGRSVTIAILRFNLTLLPSLWTIRSALTCCARSWC